MKNRAVLFSTIAFTALSGCSGDGSIIIPGNGGGDDTGAENRQLRTIDNSQEFYTALREGLLRQNSDVHRGFTDAGTTEQSIAFGGTDAGATAGATVQAQERVVVVIAWMSPRQTFKKKVLTNKIA